MLIIIVIGINLAWIAIIISLGDYEDDLQGNFIYIRLTVQRH